MTSEEIAECLRRADEIEVRVKARQEEQAKITTDEEGVADDEKRFLIYRRKIEQEEHVVLKG